MKKILTFLLILLVAGGAALVLAKDALIKAGIEIGVTGVTGFKTTVDSVKYDFPSTIRIQGLVIRNPEGFKQEVFVSMPEIYASLVLPELLQGKRIHLPEVRLNLKEVHLEKNEKGVSNVQLLTSVGGAQKEGAPGPAKPQPSGKQPAMAFLLERLELTIHDVSYEDHSGLIGAAPVSRMSVDLGVEKEIFSDIGDPQVLVNLIVMKILKGATFGKLLNINPEKLLNENLTNALNSGQKIIGEQAQALKGQIGNVTGSLEQSAAAQKTQAVVQDSLGGAQKVLGNTTSAASEKVSGLFGKMKSAVSGTETAEKAQ